MRIIPRKDPGAEVATALRGRGLRLTGPRRLVLELVRQTEVHPTAEWVHRMVRRRMPRVSLGTVYRNLRVLSAEGLVKEIAGPQTRFDGNVNEHHHFTCLSCRRIVDVEESLAAPLSRAAAKRIEARTGVSVSHQRIEFYGRCPECRGTAGSSPAVRRSRRRLS